jgi:hypothetical protein
VSKEERIALVWFFVGVLRFDSSRFCTGDTVLKVRFFDVRAAKGRLTIVKPGYGFSLN